MRKKLVSRAVALTAVVFTLVGCSGLPAPEGNPRVLHDLADGPQPWTKRSIDFDPDTVRFAVFSDLTGGEREGIFEIAIAQLNLLRPELIVNVGDLIEGSANREELEQQWESFDTRARQAQATVFYTGGNHDLLGEEMRKTWEDRLGTRYYHIRYRDVLFLVLDTEDHSLERMREIVQLRQEALDIAAEQGWEAFPQTRYAQLPEDQSGMISKSQADYMVKVLEDNQDVRWTFLLTHKAPWSNHDMLTWKSIENALGERPYTVFHGHRHTYQHQQRSGRDYIRLATTGGVFLPESGPSMDQIVWVTVNKEGAHIANLKMSGIFDKKGDIPLNGERHCLAWEDCPDK